MEVFGARVFIILKLFVLFKCSCMDIGENAPLLLIVVAVVVGEMSLCSHLQGDGRNVTAETRCEVEGTTVGSAIRGPSHTCIGLTHARHWMETLLITISEHPTIVLVLIVTTEEALGLTLLTGERETKDVAQTDGTNEQNDDPDGNGHNLQLAIHRSIVSLVEYEHDDTGDHGGNDGRGKEQVWPVAVLDKGEDDE